MFKEFFDGLTKNKEAILIIISFLGVVIPLFRYLNAKKKEQKRINFENFHEKMIRKISNIQGDAGLDEQIAVIYDLRRFPEYYSVSKRILSDLIEWWKVQIKDKPHFERLIKEANFTLEFINMNYLMRYYSRLIERFFKMFS